MTKSIAFGLLVSFLFLLVPNESLAFTQECTGGTVTHVQNYTIHTFLNSGTFDCTSAGTGVIDYLVVAGGGGGGSGSNGGAGGGGGAGGMVEGSIGILSQPYTITVGNGGSGSINAQGTNGADSSIEGLVVAIGGGGGGHRDSQAYGFSGGSGGGNPGQGSQTVTGAGVLGQGNRGGFTDIQSNGGGAGGGGKSSVGSDNSPSGGGNGGDGQSSSISGFTVFYAGGGGGAANPPGGEFTQGMGGLGGGGNGGSSGVNGQVNTGGGGGGSDRVLFTTPGKPGDGGSGIVIIRYQTVSSSEITGSGTVNRLAKFTGTSVIDSSLLSDDGSNITLTSGNLFMQIDSLIDTITNGALNFGTSQATTMTFGRSGQNMIINSKVGIGTVTPNALFHVAGDFLADIVKFGSLRTIHNCNSITSPATCGAASTGSVTMANGMDTLVVNTTSVTADSQVFITEDSSLSSRLGITCNTSTSRIYSISARVAGASFTIKSSKSPVGNPACLSYFIVN